MHEGCVNLKGNITNESTPRVLTIIFCYHKINERVISLDFLSIRQLAIYTHKILLLLLASPLYV